VTFTPRDLDGLAAAERMLSWGTCTPYSCLETVHRAFPFGASDAPGAYTHALVEWERCPADRRHPGDPNPPAGAIVLWDLYVKSLGYSAGHIALSIGGGRVVSTDWPVKGRIGVAKITDITAAWNATYLGWTNRIGGHTVITAGTPTPTGYTSQEEDMLKNDPELQARLDEIVSFIASNFTGITGVVQAEGGTTRQYVDRRVSDLAGWTRDDANRIRASLGSADPKAIAAALAPLIPAAANPAAVVDELAKRLAGKVTDATL